MGRRKPPSCRAIVPEITTGGHMRDREPTIRSRELSEGLRRAMDRAGLNGVRAAHEQGVAAAVRQARRQ
ncbi:MAG: hypothetical protein LC775_14470 [Acidobacteria bacterium]|nr:hypothetical protein [Acidobacteriota bacterium]